MDSPIGLSRQASTNSHDRVKTGHAVQTGLNLSNVEEVLSSLVQKHEKKQLYLATLFSKARNPIKALQTFLDVLGQPNTPPELGNIDYLQSIRAVKDFLFTVQSIMQGTPLDPDEAQVAQTPFGTACSKLGETPALKGKPTKALDVGIIIISTASRTLTQGLFQSRMRAAATEKASSPAISTTDGLDEESRVDTKVADQFHASVRCATPKTPKLLEVLRLGQNPETLFEKEENQEWIAQHPIIVKAMAGDQTLEESDIVELVETLAELTPQGMDSTHYRLLETDMILKRDSDDSPQFAKDFAGFLLLLQNEQDPERLVKALKLFPPTDPDEYQCVQGARQRLDMAIALLTQSPAHSKCNLQYA
ncbi:MAG: hypothetical protein O3A01_06650 [bacterium]|nr:hypothetical protein [bacterium]